VFNVFITKMFLHSFSQRIVSALPRAIFRLNIVNCMVYLTKESLQPEDDPWKGRNMSFEVIMWERLSTRNIKKFLFDSILTVYFVKYLLL
jgi:hypothetical protein